MNYAETLGAKAKASEKAMRCASAEQKNKALAAIEAALKENTEKILAANKLDMEAAEKNGMLQTALRTLSSLTTLSARLTAVHSVRTE